MRQEEIKSMLESILEKETALFDPPFQKDWSDLEVKFACQFSSEFRDFIDLMSEYRFPGDMLNVSSGVTNGNDHIGFTYDFEMSHGIWNPDLIPFYAMGNGDYFCLNSNECPESPVYYFYHEDCRVEKYTNSFGDWIKGLSDFL